MLRWSRIERSIPITAHSYTEVMMNRTKALDLLAATLLAFGLSPCITFAQPARPGRDFGSQGPMVISPEVAGDCKVTFRILAPKAQTVRVNGSDMPGIGAGADMTKATNEIWEVTLGPI